MKLLAAIRQYRALSPAQKAFIGTKQETGARPAADWVTHFAALAHYDELGDTLRRVIFLTAIATLGAGGLLFIVYNEVRNTGIFAAVVALIAAAVAAVPILILLLRLDVPNRLREVVAPLLQVVAADADATASCQLDLDLRDSVRKETETGSRPLEAPYPGKESTYRNPWLTVSWTTTDGVQCRLTIVDLVRERDTLRRSSSGKIKRKIKYKVKTLVQNVTRAPVARFGVVPKGDAGPMSAAHAGAKVAVRSGPRRHVIKSRLTLVHSRCDGPVAPDLILTAVATGFASLTPPAAAGAEQ